MILTAPVRKMYELLPGWTGIQVWEAQRDGPSKWQVRASWPNAALLNETTGLREHAVTHSKDTLEDAAAELRKLETRYQPKEPVHAETLQRDEGGDRGGGGDGGGDSLSAGVRVSRVDSGADNRAGASRMEEPVDAVSQTAPAPEYVAAEIEPSAPARPPLDALSEEVSEPPAPAYHGLMVQADLLSRRVRDLTTDIAIRRAELLESVERRVIEILSAQVGFYNARERTEADTEKFNTEQSEHAALILKRGQIVDNAESLRKALDGKTLADLDSFDVGVGWPT